MLLEFYKFYEMKISHFFSGTSCMMIVGDNCHCPELDQLYSIVIDMHVASMTVGA